MDFPLFTVIGLISWKHGFHRLVANGWATLRVTCFVLKIQHFSCLSDKTKKNRQRFLKFRLLVNRAKIYRPRICLARRILTFASPCCRTKSIGSRPRSRGGRSIHAGTRRFTLKVISLSTRVDSLFPSCWCAYRRKAKQTMLPVFNWQIALFPLYFPVFIFPSIDFCCSCSLCLHRWRRFLCCHYTSS